MTESTILTDRPNRTPRWLFFAGLAIGFLGSLCGIGGGLFAGPLLHVVIGMPLKSSAATALVLVFSTTGAATVTELLHPAPHLPLYVVGPLAIGVLLGAQAGFAVAQRIRTRALRGLFLVLLLAATARILWVEAAPPVETGRLVPSLHEALLAGAVGFGGGFLSPLMGIGGGLVMVPGLLFTLPGLGFPGARACSLAAGAFGSARALMLHGRAGRVRWATGLRLGVGAVIGAALGDLTVHVHGLREVGRPLLAVVLLFVSFRFARDLVRRNGEDHGPPVADGPTGGPGAGDPADQA